MINVGGSSQVVEGEVVSMFECVVELDIQVGPALTWSLTQVVNKVQDLWE